MKIRISDMLDNAAEIIEKENNCSNTIDSRKIKRIVFQKIQKTQVRRTRWKAVVILAAVLGLSVLSVGAKNLLQSAGFIGKDMEDVDKPQVGIEVEESSFVYQEDANLQTDLIAEENLYENGMPTAKYIAEIEIDEKNRLPECYLDNGAMLILTKEDDAGWNIGFGSILQVVFSQKRVDETGAEKTGNLEVGYIQNGVVKWVETTDSEESCIQILFETEGEAYICMRNISSDRIILTDGYINEKEGNEHES